MKQKKKSENVWTFEIFRKKGKFTNFSHQGNALVQDTDLHEIILVKSLFSLLNSLFEI